MKKFQRLSDLEEAERNLRVADRFVRVQFVRQRMHAFADETVLIDERFARGEKSNDVGMTKRLEKLNNKFESKIIDFFSSFQLESIGDIRQKTFACRERSKSVRHDR